jgi:hypothetical protein
MHRRSGPAKAAPVTVEHGEYGPGNADRMHASIQSCPGFETTAAGARNSGVRELFVGSLAAVVVRCTCIIMGGFRCR